MTMTMNPMTGGMISQIPKSLVVLLNFARLWEPLVTPGTPRGDQEERTAFKTRTPRKGREAVIAFKSCWLSALISNQPWQET